MAKPTDIQILEVTFDYEDYIYRAPLKFHGMVVDQVRLLNVHARVQTASGKEAEGFGSMPMGNIWAFPSQVLSYDETLHAMEAMAERFVAETNNCNETAHPIDLAEMLEPQFLRIADEVAKALKLAEPIPKLCALVTASPIDAALHDGFGKANGINCYNGYGKEFMSHDLSHYLYDEFEGEYLDLYTSRKPKARMPIYHLIGALDPLTDADIPQRINDGLAETLPEWIRQDGLTHLKIKLNGDDLDWDVNRVLSIDKVAAGTQRELGVETWYYSADFNERCENVEYLMAFLDRVREGSAGAFERLQYIEQPTNRDLRANPDNKMHRAAEVRPVVIDESLTDLESFELAREQGYSGVALKTCKGQSQALLMGAAAQKCGMFLCVQDLTCPGASFLHSAGLAARIPTIAAIEGNARQYVPAANEGWAKKYPEIFTVKNGTIGTGVLTKNGLGH